MTEQIKAWNQPTRPTKTIDGRAKGFGDVSVELDAIAPATLRSLVEFISNHKLGGERAVVRFLQVRGWDAQRVPLSGSSGGHFRSDVMFRVLDADPRLECKVRDAGFRRLHGWLADNDAFVIRADRREPLVVLSLARAVALLSEARQRGGP